MLYLAYLIVLVFGIFCGLAVAGFVVTLKNSRITEEEMMKELREKEKNK